MKVTAIMKDFTEQFYNGTESGSIPDFMAMPNAHKWETVKRLAFEKRVSMKIGNGQFNDQIELNRMLRNAVNIDFTIEPRKGYKLVTFNITN